ncbi:MAG TPA: DUF2285 domain-containing protein [Steroidobacteraceae bacterium]|nr:DUF2285 domain-containing protein [Steroidobacteraceae bacterium]
MPQETFHLRLDQSITCGKSFGYVLSENGRAADSLRAIADFSALYQGRKMNQTSAAFDRPARSTVYHFRTLQALDGVSVGASHRDIAAAFVGEETVAAEWSADSTLRAHVRSLIQRGRLLLNGGYRELVESRRRQAQGGIE